MPASKIAHYAQMASALQFLQQETSEYMHALPLKVEAMQAIYLQNNGGLYKASEIRELRYYQKAFMYKFYLAALALEQLWSLNYDQGDELFAALENCLGRLCCFEDDLFLISFALENFLFQTQSFLDYYLLYIGRLLRTGHDGNISKAYFYQALKEAQPPFDEKAKLARRYFDHNVFAASNRCWLDPENWGNLLGYLFTNVAHRDRLQTSFELEKPFMGKVLFEWPTLDKITFERFYQYMQNGMFLLLRDMSVILYDLEWKPGPYREGD